MSPKDAARHIKEDGLIAIARGAFSPGAACELADALAEGGVRTLEVTLNSTEALACVEALRAHADGRLLVGAGTVRTPEAVERAVAAGAQFLVAPNVDLASIERARALEVLHLPGVFTASEAQQAARAGCRLQKLFPASHAGPAYLKALRGPLDDIDFVPTGGIGAGDLAAFVRAGAVAFGVGSALLAGAHQDLGEVAEKARKMKAMLEKAWKQAGRNDAKIGEGEG